MHKMTGGKLFGWSPTAMGILNLMLYPIAALLVLTLRCLLLIIFLYIKVLQKMKQITSF